jgi:hypothetical protein
MPTAILARFVGLAEGTNPFVLTTVSHGFMSAVNEYVEGIYEAEERLHANEIADCKLRVDTQRKALAASPSLRAVCATQIQEAAKCFLARRRHSIYGIELEINSTAQDDDSESTVRVQIDGGANTNLFVSQAIRARASLLWEPEEWSNDSKPAHNRMQFSLKLPKQRRISTPSISLEIYGLEKLMVTGRTS